MSNKNWKMGQIFVAFSEYLNFNLKKTVVDSFKLDLQKKIKKIEARIRKCTQQALYSSALPHGGGIGFQWGIKTETSRWTLYMSCFLILLKIT